MHPWEHQTPGVLYKYLTTDRLDVLTSCRVRFSPRTAFDDDHELQPDYDAFGTLDEIERHIQRFGNPMPYIPVCVLARLIARNSAYQKRALQAAVSNIRVYETMGILCLTVAADSEQMWTEYACRDTGFVIGFDTAHPEFKNLAPPKPGTWGKVLYSGEGIPTFLGMMERYPFEPLFRKRTKYLFEQEWRSLRLFKDLDQVSKEIFCSPFDPACVREIIIGSKCPLESQLRDLAASGRYQHVQIEKRH
jgi:hypothetical protein